MSDTTENFTIYLAAKQWALTFAQTQYSYYREKDVEDKIFALAEKIMSYFYP